MDKAKIDTKAFIINFTNSKGDECVAYIPQPSEEEMVSIAKSLGFLFSKWKNSEMDLLVILKDWKIMLDEFLGENTPQKTALNGFFERKISLGNIFNKQNGEQVKGNDLNNSDYEVIQGSLLFYVSVLRYATALYNNEKLRAVTTSLSALDYQKSLKK